MRSPIGPILVLFGLATTVVLVLLLFQNMGMRSELESTRAELDALSVAVSEQEPGLTDLDLDRQLTQLEVRIRDWLVSNGADGGSPGTDSGAVAAIAERLDEISEQIEALDSRIDEICENVPVC